MIFNIETNTIGIVCAIISFISVCLTFFLWKLCSTVLDELESKLWELKDVYQNIANLKK